VPDSTDLLWLHLLWLLGGALAATIILGAALIPATRVLLRRAQLRAREAERRARQAERLAELGSMTGGLAHEIRNPLSTVGLNAQMLAEEIAESELPPEQRDRMLRRIGALGREADRLRDILGDFLRFAGRIVIDPAPHDLRDLIEELADFLVAQCQQSGVLLRVDVPPEADGRATIDAALVKQALLNLMLNAIQAMIDGQSDDAKGDGGDTRRGDLILRLEGDDDEVRIHVIDTGPGIDAKSLESIFHPYVTGKPGGTGLGLPTARRIVEEHGGRIVVHSRAGQGSDFVVHLPRRPVADSPK